MRPLLLPVFVAAFLGALLLPMAGSASVGHHSSPPAVTITASPMAVVDGGSTDISGTVFKTVNDERRLTVAHDGAPGPDVWLGFYKAPGCSPDDYVSGQVAPVTWEQTTVWDKWHHHSHNEYTGNGTYGPVTSDLLAVGDYSFRAGFDNQTACVDVTVTKAPAPVTPPPAPAGENSFFLCYSVFQVDPGVWPYHIAAQLMAGGGYWQPYAVKGNVQWGTNVGDYHLVCNIATGQAAGQQFAGAGGDISGAEAFPMLTGQLGWYPVVP
jgi:hypothetical protein